MIKYATTYIYRKDVGGIISQMEYSLLTDVYPPLEATDFLRLTKDELAARVNALEEQIGICDDYERKNNFIIEDEFMTGMIVMWSGTEVPAEWALCDGQNGTPDLRGRFIVGQDPNSLEYNNIGNIGGGGCGTANSRPDSCALARTENI